MVTEAQFQKSIDQFGHFASWAVWAEVGDKPKSNIADLKVLDPIQNTDLLNILHGHYILVGLNISRPIERKLGNFHDPRPMATDFKIRYALKGTKYWGSYMTDVIKDFEEKASGKMMNYLSQNKDFEHQNIQTFLKEIEVLEFKNPKLIAFGKDSEKILNRNLKSHFEIIGIPHYACQTGKEKYRQQVLSILGV